MCIIIDFTSVIRIASVRRLIFQPHLVISSTSARIGNIAHISQSVTRFITSGQVREDGSVTNSGIINISVASTTHGTKLLARSFDDLASIASC